MHKLQKLIDAGLFGAGLTAVDTPLMVDRYNQCLGQLGIEPTTLQSFSIDGIGWSPEVATEKNDVAYLCAGIANPMGVILSPNQNKRPIYFPFSSYERPMMYAYFDRHINSIADITTTSYIGLDIDQDLTRYETPSDLALVRYVVLRSVAGGLFDAAKRQKEIVDAINGDGLAWFDQKLRNELAESGMRWGDLRHRRADISDFRFDINSFHTQAFGGVFVLRSQHDGATTLVLEDVALLQKQRRATLKELYIRQKDLGKILQEKGFIELNLEWYRAHPDVIDHKKECMLADAVCAQNPDIDFAGMKVAQRRQWAHRLADTLPVLYHRLERVSQELANGGLVEEEDLTKDVVQALWRPSPQLSEDDQDVVWLLLCRLQPHDVYRLYVSDKSSFYTTYEQWPVSKQDWATKFIREKYIPRMNQ